MPHSFNVPTASRKRTGVQRSTDPTKTGSPSNMKGITSALNYPGTTSPRAVPGSPESMQRGTPESCTLPSRFNLRRSTSHSYALSSNFVLHLLSFFAILNGRQSGMNRKEQRLGKARGKNKEMLKG
ncbi:hypothetical protein PoB_007654900 [Plakobranchus ocellatus]|uniref:Uncharacterized protein n=1 Tax=Plakobranchus ocellatus TaxID=259542 RepID=A0AAV4E180_9GAST|nr:hypothetical protein PoB_007654900 [Plakobranchus ocellatus]